VLELRRFEDADGPAVRDLHDVALADAGAHLGNGPWDDDLRSISSAYLQDGGEFLVGLLDGRLVAMGALRHVTDSVAEIKRMRVHPGFQRRGFGRLVLARLEEQASTLGYSKLRLDTTVMQRAAQALYQRKGYREVGRGQLAGVEVIYYEKRLA
jgi:GNAT superfamily N-acetyltransferase